ncbi:alpha/beta fold hydrolase [Pedomonas mirosovicensis]|uniref:alpha/beta fold hydrolase n=1 Tax=Pedomonas mirosovicensis TaxID=2908641 RepID=UPI002169F9B4|nr:alpha/beta fold hydrolase [Pedomonas mirosovicensis]MCH8684976.1 alpha/beta fold hydrolase [Pedomonas mirosovicensis]
MRLDRGPHPLGFYLSQLLCRTAADPGQAARLERFLTALRRYQAHPWRRDLLPPPAVAEAGSARLLAYGGSGPAVVFVPSLINPAWVLDLSAQRSLMRWLATQGLRPFLVDWGTPGPEERGFDLNAYVTRRLLPLIEQLGEPVTLAGYCLGGTLGVAAACLSPQVERLALLAAPWVFSAYDDQPRQDLAAFAAQWEPLAESLGVFPAEALQIAFWALDPDLLERKFARFAAYDPASLQAEDFIALEDWANSGPPLSLPAARQCFEAFFGRDEPGLGAWRIGETAIDPARLTLPALVISASGDRIVPQASSSPLSCHLSRASALCVEAGHVGMIVGRRAPALLWEPLARWLLSR